MVESFSSTNNDKSSKKERILKELKTEPLKYALEIAEVKNAEELVDKLSEVETKGNFEKVFAKLKNISNLSRVKVIYKSLNYLGDYEPGESMGPTRAMYHEASNTIYIDSTYSNSAEVADFYITILHELFHEVFKGAEKASAVNMIFGLPNIKNTIQKLPIHNKYRHLYSTTLLNVSKEEKQNHYGLSSVDEFISETYANPEFQEFLKSVDLNKKRNISHKVSDLLLSVVTLNARIISKEISEKDAFSAFKKIDLESLDILEDFKKNLEAVKDDTDPHASP